MSEIAPPRQLNRWAASNVLRAPATQFVMRTQDAKALGCISLLIGVFLSISIPFFFIGAGVRSEATWIVFAPGWAIFRVGHADLGEFVMATMLDSIIYAAVIYGLVYAAATLLGRTRA